MVMRVSEGGNSHDDIFSEVPEVALNPLAGLHINDLVATAGKAAFQGIKQPVILAKHVAGLAGKLLDVFTGDKQYQPKKGITGLQMQRGIIIGSIAIYCSPIWPSMKALIVDICLS